MNREHHGTHSQSSHRSPPVQRAVVVGGGIAGLTAAWRLHQLGQKSRTPLEIRLLEGSNRLGGLIRSLSWRDCLLEAGPDTMIASKRAGLDLCKCLDLEDDLVFPQRNGGLQILNHGRLTPLPKGFRVVAPTRLWPTLRSRLFSPWGKLRMAGDLILPRRRAAGDEALGAFIQRRMGKEVLERVVQPILSSIYLTDIEKLSLNALMPQLAVLERRFGSLIKGFSATRPRPGGSDFFSLRSGLSQLVEALEASLPRGTVQKGLPVKRVTYVPQNGRWQVSLEGEPSLNADVVILACPAYAAAEMIAPGMSALTRELETLEYASCATLNLIYRRGAIHRPMKANGFFVPGQERLSFLACNFVHSKFPQRVPTDHAVLRAFVGGPHHRGLLEWEDQALLDKVHGELARLLDIQAKPIRGIVFRHPRAMPQIEVGFVEKSRRIQSLLDAKPGLFMAGGATGAVGLPDCIASGDAAGGAAAGFLAQKEDRQLRAV